MCIHPPAESNRCMTCYLTVQFCGNGPQVFYRHPHEELQCIGCRNYSPIVCDRYSPNAGVIQVMLKKIGSCIFQLGLNRLAVWKYSLDGSLSDALRCQLIYNTEKHLQVSRLLVIFSSQISPCPYTRAGQVAQKTGLCLRQ